MIKLFRKDLILFFNDYRSYILTFLIPIILITLFAFAYGAIEQYSDEKSTTKLPVTDLDMTGLSARFIAVLDSINGIELLHTDIEQARESITEGKYAAALVLQKGFMDSLLTARSFPLELLYDREQNSEAGMLQAIIVNVMFSFSRELDKQLIRHTGNLPGSPDPSLSGHLQDSHVNKSPALKMTSIVGEKNGRNLGLIQAVAGTAILMLLFSVAGIGTSILEEKENGTINRLMFSPVSLRTILLSKMLFALFIALLQLTLMFLFSWIFLDLDIFINPQALVLMILSTAFAVSSLGIFLAAIAKSRQQALSLSTLVILVMSALGGSMIPLFIMPDIMNDIAVISVNYWSIQGFYDIFWRSLPLSQILPRIFMLTGFGLVFSFFSIRLFSKNILSLI
ncbi:MAG: ABC transporter permease [Marinilabiliaceae bacterium]|jgi:ABC-type multidrug transport system permease subunit|nr:ABC transporter permease [Marinilabiliaceae bacterium]